MSKNTMQIFSVGKGRFAIGTLGKLARYVVLTSGKKVRGVRGRRPLLAQGRFERATNVSAAVRDALKAAIA